MLLLNSLPVDELGNCSALKVRGVVSKITQAYQGGIHSNPTSRNHFYSGH